MIEFQKQADGSWKRFGEALPDEEPVTISLSNASTKPPYRFSLELSTVPAKNAPVPDKVQHSGAVEGEFTWAEAIAIVERMIRDNEVGMNNLCQVQSAMYRVVADGLALAQRDLIAKHPEWLHPSAKAVPSDFHKYSVNICRPSDGQVILTRGGSLELCDLIKERLQQRFSGKICDPDGKIIEEWTR